MTHKESGSVSGWEASGLLLGGLGVLAFSLTLFTLLNCLAAAIPARKRVVLCEEVFELQPSLPACVAMQTRQPSLESTGGIRLRRLVKEALRMCPDRLLG